MTSALQDGVGLGFWSGGLSYSDAYGNTWTVPFGQQDSDGNAWCVVGLTGMDGPDTVGSVAQRSGDDGGWATPAFFAPRVMTLTVTATCVDQTSRDLARARLQAACPVNDLATLTFGESITKTMQVRRSGKLGETSLNLGEVTFTVGLVAPDYRKYRSVYYSQSTGLPATAAGLAAPWTAPLAPPSNTPAGALQILNAGNTDTPPVLTVVGPMDAGFSVTSTTANARLRFPSVSLVAGDQFVIDTLNRQSFLNGAYRPAGIGSVWWRLVPGSNSIRFGGNSSDGTGHLTVTWRDAWK